MQAADGNRASDSSSGGYPLTASIHPVMNTVD